MSALAFNRARTRKGPPLERLRAPKWPEERENYIHLGQFCLSNDSTDDDDVRLDEADALDATVRAL